MECNKDEAIRARTIAENKLSEKDYTGAKKFILKAQILYPNLDGTSQMLTSLEVYIASENKVNGEVDWYGILGANPNDDDETIRKNYRKLALLLHPDKNKSVGADGAFKLLSEAWSLLSDKSKRSAYNQRRNFKSFQQSQTVNGVHTKPKPPVSKPTIHKTATRPPPRDDTFWTNCHQCKMHFEYLKVYLNHTLICQNCNAPFVAKEIPPPVNLKKPPPVNLQKSPPVNLQKPAGGAFTRPNVDPTTATKAANIVQQVVNGKLKKENSNRPSKKRKADDITPSQSQSQSQSQSVKIPFQMSTNGVHNIRVNKTRELTSLEMRNILMKKAQTEIKKKLNEWEAEEKLKEAQIAKKAEEEKEKEKEKAKEKEKEKAKEKEKESENEDENENENENEDEEEIDEFNVPDADFHNFDFDRTEDSFSENQVWAAYDDDDGMPRFYAIIHNVISRKPLKMKISWLNSKTTSEFGSLNWLSHGFRKVCGEFRVGKHELYKTLNSFSQNVAFTRTPRGTVLIIPRKGEVWAVYRNWDKDWDENVPDEVVHKYDMVEILEDYDEEKGVKVSWLKKCAGFRTVFEKESEVKVIKKKEMFRFSHQVPKYVLRGDEGQNCPKGCLELDPAATPLDLIQESNENVGGKGKDGNGKDGDGGKVLLVYSRRNRRTKA